MKPRNLPPTAETLPDITWRPCLPAQTRNADGSPRPPGHPVFIDGAFDDDFAGLQVYRYCSLPEAFELLGGKRWAFTHPSKWPDPYESHVSSRLFGEGGPFAGAGIFAKCLSVDFRSNALWSMYSGRYGVVRIGIRVQDLVSVLSSAIVTAPDAPARALKASFYVSRCRYMEPTDIRRETDRFVQGGSRADTRAAMRVLTMKRDGFQYENEVRIAMLLGRHKSPASAPVRHLQLHRLPVQSILLDPYLAAHEAPPLENLMRRLAPRALVRRSGFNLPPEP
jgi:hypothetical protein